ncbi:hypothetical protein GCM10009557_03010 [Virgisporangium ochraceum]|uniref:Uncharacterized protein n=1 Tax=Virgisporangium ochraceum TaxID=65505 RepID=A0A8J3ZT82_9ACTN|nr:hypothetical protein [Virgisporangium ochraceum]GIJ67965.1 hypothetical protein Voc01_028820 [Virgisporangium ochraceum]
MANRMAAAMAARLHRIRIESDRGDNPVPTAIIIAGLALLAAAVVGWAVARANGFMNTAPGGPAT